MVIVVLYRCRLWLAMWWGRCLWMCLRLLRIRFYYATRWKWIFWRGFRMPVLRPWRRSSILTVNDIFDWHLLVVYNSYNVLVHSVVKICDVFWEYNTYDGSQTTATNHQGWSPICSHSRWGFYHVGLLPEDSEASGSEIGIISGGAWIGLYLSELSALWCS